MTTAVDTVNLAPSRTQQTTLAQRLGRVVRLHLANPWTPIVWPVMILTFIFLANYAIWQLIIESTEAGDVSGVNNGGVGFVLIYMLVIAVQAMNATFPFAMGFGVTRRDFYLGSGVFFGVLSLVYAAGLTVLAQIELWTDGWGLQAQFFALEYLGASGPWETFQFFLLALLFFFFLGAAVATVYVRWKANGLYVFFGALVVLVIGLVWLATRLDAWAAVGQFFVDSGAIGTAYWSLVLTLTIAICGYLILRRASPRS